MKRLMVLASLALVFILAGCIRSINQNSAPQLFVGLEEQNIQAWMGSGSWSSPAQDMGWTWTGIPLFADDFGGITLCMKNRTNEISLKWENGFEPYEITVRRWKVEYWENWDKHEVLELEQNDTIPVTNDGNDYIYEVSAQWVQGRVHYTFRVNGLE